MSIDETTQPSEKCYDEKHNVQCDEVTQSPTEAPKKDIRGMSGTMSLVIGIILGSFIAMILIVIIVLKVRTGVDITELKQVTAQVSIFSVFIKKVLKRLLTYFRVTIRASNNIWVCIGAKMM